MRIMGIEDFKRWHWIVVGMVVGVALAYAWVSMDIDIEGIRGADQREFERDVVLKDESSGQPLITGIVIRPAEDSFDGRVNVVTYKRLAKDRQGRYGWATRRLVAHVPYKPAIPGRVKFDRDWTIDTYLGELSVQGNPISFQYGWWLQPRNAVILGAVAGALIVGGVWPTLLNLMIGAGFGRKRDPNAPKESAASRKKLPRLRWFRRASDPRPQAIRPAVSAAEKDELSQVAGEYEKTLQSAGVALGAGQAGSAAASDAASAAAPAVRKLESGPAEPVAINPQDQDEIEVKAKEFYPVLIHHQKPKSQPQTSTGEQAADQSK